MTRCSILEYPDRAKAPRPGDGQAVNEDGLLYPGLSAVMMMLVMLVDLVDEVDLVRDVQERK